MAGKSDWFKQKLAEFLFEGVSFTPPATYYFHLCTVAITSNMTGSTITKCTASGYAGQSKAANSTNFDYTAPSGADLPGTESNLTAITFPTMTSVSTQNCVGLAVTDSLSGGNLVGFKNFTDPIVINSNPNTPSIPIGDLDFLFN